MRDQITQVWFDDMDALHITDLAYWFEDCVSLTTAEIPSTTPVIGKHAFYNCPKLSTLTIYYGEDILESIGEDAFWRKTDSGDTLYIGYIIGYPKSSVPFYDYDWAGSNRNEQILLRFVRRVFRYSHSRWYHEYAGRFRHFDRLDYRQLSKLRQVRLPGHIRRGRPFLARSCQL